jgi:LPS export ABC transporter protein LptC
MKRPIYILLILLCGSVWAAGCAPPKQRKAVPAQPTKKEKSTPPPAIKMLQQGGKIKFTDAEGKQIWDASAEIIEGDFSSGSGRLKKMRARMIEKGKADITASANEATFLPSKRIVVLQGNAKINWPGKLSNLQAQKVKWGLDDHTLIATGKVQIESTQNGRKDLLRGDYLQADTDLKSFEIGDVK